MKKKKKGEKGKSLGKIKGDKTHENVSFYVNGPFRFLFIQLSRLQVFELFYKVFLKILVI